MKLYTTDGLVMKKIWFIIALAGFGCSKAQLPVTPPEPQTTLQVTAIKPNGDALDSAKVYLNSNFVGVTPYHSQSLQPGMLALRVMKDGYQVFTTQLAVQEGESYSIEALLIPLQANEGELLVTTNQDSAVVRILDLGNNVVAQTQDRVSSHKLPPGAYLVSGEKSGFSKVVKAADVVAGKVTAVHLELTSLTGNPPTLEFSIDPDTVELGEAFTLRWQSNGHQVIIDQGVGVRGPNGSEKKICHSTGLKIFTAAAYGEDNLITEKKDSVFIAPKQVHAPTLEFSVAQDSIVFGESAAIEWSSDGYQVAIDQGVGVRGPVGSEEVSFANPGKKIFTAAAYGEGNLITIRRDSVYVKEAPTPILPVVLISTTAVVQVNTPATISWLTQNADYVVVDYVNNAGLQGSEEVTFSTTGIRIVTATAFNRAGYASATDTITVVEPAVNPVDDIIVSAQVNVRADKGESGMKQLDAATIEIETAGRYLVYAEVWYNSGDDQRNESFYLELRDSSSRVKLPRNPNAGTHLVVPDDPGEPHTMSRASGEFKLSAGTHSIDVYHYAKIAAQYPQFLNGAIDGPESVKILGFKLVYLGN